MNTKILFLSGAGILTLSLVFALVLSSSSQNLSYGSPESSLEECHTLSFTGEDSINLVFFGSKKDSEDYSNYLFSIEPYKDNKESFNIYYIDSGTYTPSCVLYKGQALLCDNDNLRKKAASCPNDFIFVLQKSEDSIRSSAKGPTASINTNSQVPKNVIVHEFGHTFANLAEEYISSGIPLGAKNCPSSCDSFLGLENGCFEGCSKQDRIRSVDRGIMRTLWNVENPSAPYGGFNNMLITEQIEKRKSSTITGLSILESPEDCQDSQYLLLRGSYSTEGIDLTEQGIYSGCAGTNGIGDYNYNLQSDSNNIDGSFNPFFIFTDGQDLEEEEISGETFIDKETEIVLTFPYELRSSNLEVYDDEGNQILSTSLSNAGARPCKK